MCHNQNWDAVREGPGFDGWLDNHKGIAAISRQLTRSKFQPSCWRYLLPFFLPSFLLPAAHRAGFIVVEQMAKLKHHKQLIPEAGEG